MAGWLWVHAHAREGLPELSRALCVGVGKTAAAVALGRALALDPRPPSLVVAFGVAGAYPDGGLGVGDLCLVGDDCLADEGVAAPDGFLDLAALQLGDAGPWSAAPEPTAALAQRLSIPVVPGATVSTCSGTDALSTALAARTGAAIETMEGAAIAAASAAAGVPWIQLRAISNRTGDRARAGWNLDLALRHLHAAVRTAAAANFGERP